VTEQTPPIVGLADSIVRQDVVDGRPGKTIAPPVVYVPLVDVIESTGDAATETPAPEVPGPPSISPWWRSCCCLLLAIALIVLVGDGAIGYLTWHEPSRLTSLDIPDFPVSIVPQKPDVSTVPGSSTFNGTSQMTLHYTCGTQASQLALPALLQIGSGRFFLDPQGIPPFDGTLSSANAINAPGQLGTVTGTLVSGQTENLTLTTGNFPCKGVFPLTLQLPTALNLGGGSTTGPPLASTFGGNVAFDSTPMGGSSGARDVPWILIIGGVVLDLIAILLARRYPLRRDEWIW
jgi:hypothetical protein